MTSSDVQTPIAAGQVYFFTKSGNQVRTVARAAPYHGQPCWTVVRTQGQSAGKEMTVPEAALATQIA